MKAYPLFLNDPFFSIWTGTTKLNDSDTIFWTGETKRTYGILKVDGKSYSFMGCPEGMEKMEQKEVSLSLFRTDYLFSADEADLKVSFFSPLPLSDLKLMSMPTAYLEYEILPKKPIGKAEVILTISEDWCHIVPEHQEMRGDVFATQHGEVGFFGLERQELLNRTGDRIAADWGYYFIGAQSCYCHSIPDFQDVSKELTFDVEADTTVYLTGVNTHEKLEAPAKDKFIVAFDDVASINYYGRVLKGYYLSEDKSVMDAIAYSYTDYDKIQETCDACEKQLIVDCKKYSEDYLHILNVSYRQVVAAHKLVADYDGSLLYFSKECGSGGCLATADVTYPTMPMLALYCPELLKASMEPVFKMASLPMWDYPFAPHDAGMYPYSCGQIYRVKNRQEGKYHRNIWFRNDWKHDVLPPYYLFPKASDIYYDQMPIEECGNMLLITALYLASGGEKEYIGKYLPLLDTWCNYLIDKGLIPENQLCTDDFMEYQDKNMNLALKAIVAIRSYGSILEQYGKDGSRYEAIAKERVEQIKRDYGHTYLPLSFGDTQDTYSIKYNLLFDKLLGYNMFEQEFLEREVQVCLDHMLPYGFPLDSRTKLTKTDWMLWMAALSDKPEAATAILKALRNYIDSDVSPHKPFPDIYDCETGEQGIQFVNRTVQGSMFVLLLKDKLLSGGKQL